MAHREIPGSTHVAPYGAYRVNNSDPDGVVEATLVLRRAVFDAQAETVSVQQFANEHGLSVVASNPAGRSVIVSGTVAQMNLAFQVDLGDYAHEGATYRGREGTVSVPEEIWDSVVAVLGLDERKVARRPQAVSPRAQSGMYATQVAQMYGFPTTADGTGQTIAIIELGGGYRTADLQNYFQHTVARAPSVNAVLVGGARNAPGGDADAEVCLDIEVAGAVAPGAAQAVYFAPNTDQGFYQAIAAAVNDTGRKPSIISISWGGPESSWPTATLTAFDALFADAAEAGITVLAAAGDNGSSDGTNGAMVDFPASSPNVVACGGTKLTSSGESVWNEAANGEGATGGGVSQFFAKPDYQANVAVPGNGRGVPDVAGDADPVTGYTVLVDGQWGVVGGTSAVAPLWAGLIALSNQINANRAGAPHAKLYATPGAFNDITVGSNGAYSAGVGWDCCTGLGSPKGGAVVAALATNPTSPPPPPDSGGAPAPSDTAALLAYAQARQAALNADLAAVAALISALGALDD